MTPTQAERDHLHEAIRRAHETAGRDDGREPIVAAVLRGDHVIAWGTNEVHLAHDPTRHAEIVAISRATHALGAPDLAGATLVSTLQPCEMCLSAIRWAGITRVIFAAGQGDVPDMYFSEPHLKLADHLQPDDDVTVIGPVDADMVLPLYRDAG